MNSIRAIRDRYQLLETKFKRNMQKEVNASGINVEPTEFDDAMEDLIDLFENQEANAARHGQLTLKQLRLSVLNEVHTNS